MATERSYEVLVLIRTGSAFHNIKVAKKALVSGLKLDFSKGLIDVKTGNIIDNTEKGILEKLGFGYIEPRDRN